MMHVIDTLLLTVRHELSIDRTEVVPASDVLKARLAFIPLIAVFFVFEFGSAVVDAVNVMISYDPHAQVEESYVDGGLDFVRLRKVAILLFGMCLACVAMHMLRRMCTPQCMMRHPMKLRTGIMAFFVACVPLALANVINNLLYQCFGLYLISTSSTTDINMAAMVSWIVTSFLAGFGEEPVMLGLLVVGLRRCRFSWPVIAVVAVILRASMHLFYGWPVIFDMMVWPVLYVMLYRRTGSIVPIILAHGMYDMLLTIDTYMNFYLIKPTAYEIVWPTLVWIGVAIVVVKFGIEMGRCFRHTTPGAGLAI